MSLDHEEFDPFAPLLESKGFSADNYYTKSRSNGERDWFKLPNGTTLSVPPWVHACVMQIVADDPGYKTFQGFLRDACVQTAKMRHDKMKGPSSELNRLMEQMVKMEEAERYEQKIQFHEEVIKKIRNLLERAKGADVKLEAEAVVRALAETLDFPHYVRLANRIIEEETWS